MNRTAAIFGSRRPRLVRAFAAWATVLVLVLLALVPTSVPSARASASPVGLDTFISSDTARQRRLEVAVWYPADDKAELQTFAPRAALRGFEVAPRAAYAGQGSRPAVVLSHGNWGTQYSLAWLATALVRHGFVVVSLQHPGTAADDRTLAGRVRLWDRAEDVSRVLDDVLRHPLWSARIDPERVGFAGHSFGGWTGVALAGGRFDPAAQLTACRRSPDRDLYCESANKEDSSDIPVADADRSLTDPRLKAFYVMASGPTDGFLEGSLRVIRAPFAIDTPSSDDVLASEPNSGRLAALIPGARAFHRAAGHFTYVPRCKFVIGPVLTRVLGAPICDDPEGVDREAVHRSVADDAVSFFAAHLGSAR